MRTQSMDTSIDIERILIQGHQRFSPAQRFARVRSLTASIAEMNRRGTRLDDEAAIPGYLQHLYGTTFVETLPALPDMRSARVFDILIPMTTMADLVTDLPHMLALTGGIACCLYGFPRTVRDIDLLVDATTPSFPTLLERLATHFLPARSVDSVRSFLDPKTLIKIDVVTELDGLSSREILSRASPVMLTENGVTFPVLSAEDVVLSRLAWYRETGSRADDQWNDLMGVVKVQAPSLDGDSLRSRAHDNHLDDLLVPLFTDCEFGGCTDVSANEHAGSAPDSRTRH